MMKRLLTAEHKAKVHVNATHALQLAFIDQLSNFDLPLEEWERTMKKLDLAFAALKGRYDALWELRLDTTYAVEKDAYKSMKDSWSRYYLLARNLEKKQENAA